MVSDADNLIVSLDSLEEFWCLKIWREYYVKLSKYVDDVRHEVSKNEFERVQMIKNATGAGPLWVK